MKLFYLWMLPGLMMLCSPGAEAQDLVAGSDPSGTTDTTHRFIKRKVAIGRFSNETQYGKSIFYDKDNDPMGKQAFDILSAKLAASDKFLLLERSDMDALLEEGRRNGNDFSSIGADYMIIGSITEYGRKTVGKSNVFTSSKSQIVEAMVALRIVDLSTGLVIYSDEGSGEASTTTKSKLFNSQSAEYDATLSDKAIAAAISQLVENVINRCTDKPWRTYFLPTDGKPSLIAGGKSQGIRAGDEFAIVKPGEMVRNPQNGIMIELPGKTVGRLRVTDTGGDTPETEYSFVEIIDLQPGEDPSALRIEEFK